MALKMNQHQKGTCTDNAEDIRITSDGLPVTDADPVLLCPPIPLAVPADPPEPDRPDPVRVFTDSLSPLALPDFAESFRSSAAPALVSDDAVLPAKRSDAVRTGDSAAGET